MVSIVDPLLHQDYLDRVIDMKIRFRQSIIQSTNKSFEDMFKTYQENHREYRGRINSLQRSSIHTKHKKLEFIHWYLLENLQILPLFIWEDDVSQEDMEYFEKHRNIYR